MSQKHVIAIPSLCTQPSIGALLDCPWFLFKENFLLFICLIRTLINTERYTSHGLGSTSFIKREPRWPFIRSFVSQRKNSVSKRYNCISGQNVTERNRVNIETAYRLLHKRIHTFILLYFYSLWFIVITCDVMTSWVHCASNTLPKVHLFSFVLNVKTPTIGSLIWNIQHNCG